MAEDLGHIDIQVHSGSGGGAADTTGPLPTKIKMPDIGALVKSAMTLLAGTITSIMRVAMDQVISRIRAAMDFIHDAAAEMRESGKFSPAVMQENIAMQLQTLSNQFQEARFLGPLYGMVLRWYRELMALLQPWKLLFSSIFAFLAGTLVSLFKAVMTAIAPLLENIMALLAKGLGALATKFMPSDPATPGLLARFLGGFAATTSGIGGGPEYFAAVAQTAISAGPFGEMLREMKRLQNRQRNLSISCGKFGRTPRRKRLG